MDLPWPNLRRGEIPRFPLIVRRSELIDDGYLPAHLRDQRPVAESLDAPRGAHVENWRSQDFPATDTPEAFLAWLRYTLPQFDSWEAPVSLAESLADAGYSPANLDWANAVHDAYVIVRVLQDHRGYPAFDRDEPAACDLVSARNHLRAIRDWVRTNMTSQPQDAAAELRGGPVVKPQDVRQGLPTTRRQRQIKWLAEAMLLVREHPDWPDAEIALRVGKNPSTLSRNPSYQAAAAMSRGDKSDLPKGYVTGGDDGESSDLEAYGDDWENQ